MLSTPLFKRTFILLAIIGFLDYIANKFYFYWTIWWYDMLMHFSAGVCVGMATVLVWYFYHKTKDLSLSKMVSITLISILFIGVLWEIYELVIGVTSFSDGVVYVTDTTSDLLLDICGAIIGSVYAKHLSRNMNKI